MINKHSPLTKRTARPYILFPAIALGVIATVWFVFLILTHIDQQKKDEQAATTQTAGPSQAIESLKTQAAKKLQDGDQEGGLKDLRQALSLAEKDHLTKDITYLQQQIDYAENSQFSGTKSAKPAPAPTNTSSPGYSRQ